MAEEDGSKPKYEVEEISIKTRVQKILDLSTTRSDLLIGLSYCKNRTKTILLPGREYCLQSTKHSFTLHLMYILHSIRQNTFQTQQKKRATLCTDWRPVTTCKLHWEGSPNTRSSLRKYSIVHVSWTYSSCYFTFFTNKHCFHVFFQPQDVADLVSSEVRNVLSKINGMVYESRHKYKRFAEGIFITPFPLLRDNTSSALSSYISVFLTFTIFEKLYCCSIALHRS